VEPYPSPSEYTEMVPWCSSTIPFVTACTYNSHVLEVGHSADCRSIRLTEQTQTRPLPCLQQTGVELHYFLEQATLVLLKHMINVSHITKMRDSCAYGWSIDRTLDMPGPVSITWMRSRALRTPSGQRTTIPLRTFVSVKLFTSSMTLPSLPVNFRALDIRFRMTWPSLAESPKTYAVDKSSTDSGQYTNFSCTWASLA